MKKWMSILFCLFVAACGYRSVYNGQEPFSLSRFFFGDNPKHTLDYFTEALGKDLMATNTYLTPSTPMAIVSFVDLEHMGQTNWLGNALTEGMIYQMQRQGFTVIDFKNTGFIRVTEKGDFILSQNWRELVPEQPIEYVLTGTMLRQSGGVIVNARIIGMESHVVVASAQGFLPADRIGRDLDTLNKVRMKDGVIIRDEQVVQEKEIVVLKP